MARALRIQYPGAVYHVTCRGNERKEIIKDDFDKKNFLKILTDSRRIYNSWRVSWKGNCHDERFDPINSNNHREELE